jgi:hypothetical protein
VASTSTIDAGNLSQLVSWCGDFSRRQRNRKPLINKTINAWRQTCSPLSKTRRTPLIVFVLLAAILMLVGITVVSAIDFTHGKRR